MILNAIQWTSGQTYDNCVTFNEVKDLLATAVGNGDVTPAANTSLGALLDTADAAHRAGNDAAAATAMNTFVAQTKNTANCACGDGGKDLLALQSKGVELVGWMTGNEAAPPAPAFSTTATSGPGGTVPATLSLTLGAPGDVRRVHAGRRQGLHRRRPRPPSSRPPVTRRSRVADPSTTNTGKLVNGTFAAAAGAAGQRRRRVRAGRRLRRSDHAEDLVRPDLQRRRSTITFKQSIGANDALRTGTYSKTLTFTLSTTTP